MKPPRLSSLAGSLLGSEILKIAADVRALGAEGLEICNLTVGDFAPSEFRIPGEVEQGIIERLRRGETNYPPADGLLPLREAVRTLYRRELGLDPRRLRPRAPRPPARRAPRLGGGRGGRGGAGCCFFSPPPFLKQPV